MTTLVRFLTFFIVSKKTYKIGKNVQVRSIQTTGGQTFLDGISSKDTPEERPRIEVMFPVKKQRVLRPKAD